MPWLVCARGEDKGLQFEIGEKTVVMGRAPDCDIQIVESRASRYHCKLFMNRDRLYVEDMNSTNGIKHGGKRLQGKRIRLKVGGSFGIGSDVFNFSKGQDQYLEASEDLISSMGKHGHGQVVDKTLADALSDQLKRKKESSGLFSLFRKSKKR